MATRLKYIGFDNETPIVRNIWYKTYPNREIFLNNNQNVFQPDFIEFNKKYGIKAFNYTEFNNQPRVYNPIDKSIKVNFKPYHPANKKLEYSDI